MRTFFHQIILLIVFTHCSYISRAQEKTGRARIDSLLKQLPKLNDDTSKVKLLNELSETYAYINNNEGIKVGEQSLALAQKLNWQKGIANALNSIGAGFEANSDFPKALEYYLKALKLFEALGHKPGIAKSLGNVGIIYDYQSDYTKALEYYFRVLKMLEESGDKSGTAGFLGNIAVVYKNQSKYSEALEYSFKALDIYKELGDTYGIAINLNNIGVVYDMQSDHVKALEYYSQELKLLEELGDKDAIAVTLGNIGAVYFTLAISENKTASAGKSTELFGGNKNKLLQHAKIYIDSSISIFKELGHLDELAAGYKDLSDIQRYTGDYKGALISYQAYATLKDSVFNMEKDKKITENAMQYEFDKKEAIAKAEQEKKDAEAKLRKYQQFFILLGVAAIALIQFINNKKKQKANLLLQLEKEKVETTLSELKSTQAQLIQSEKMASLGELTAGIAHEIQNPLNFVNNFSEINTELISELKTELATGNLPQATGIADDIQDNEQKILHHGKRADAIVKSMLQHSRTSKAQKEPTDINALCDEYLRLSYHGMRAKDPRDAAHKEFNAVIKTDFDETIEKINIVPQDIGRVLLNLFNNAFYATSEKLKAQSSRLEAHDSQYVPQVTIVTKRLNARPDDPVGRDKIEIRVADNGPGIPQNIIDKIFQPFFTTKPTGQGTGLGLSLSYDIIKSHSGEIKVESNQGEGSLFLIQLPSV